MKNYVLNADIYDSIYRFNVIIFFLMRIHNEGIKFLDADEGLQKKLNYIAETYVIEFESQKQIPEFQATSQAQRRLLMWVWTVFTYSKFIQSSRVIHVWQNFSLPIPCLRGF